MRAQRQLLVRCRTLPAADDQGLAGGLPLLGVHACKAASGETGKAAVVYRERPQSAVPSDETILMIDFYALTSPNVQKIFIML